MQFQLLSTLALAAMSVANPVPAANAAQALLCPNGQSALCCQFQFGIIGATCQQPGPRVKSLAQFEKHCSNKGYVAQCCTQDFGGIGFTCSSAPTS